MPPNELPDDQDIDRLFWLGWEKRLSDEHRLLAAWMGQMEHMEAENVAAPLRTALWHLGAAIEQTAAMLTVVHDRYGRPGGS
jgi:hypothetical protein